MSTQAKSKLYLLIIGILLATNIAMLFFCFGNKTEPKKSKGNIDRSAMMKDFLKKDIGFSDEQVQLYDTLSKNFKQKSRADMDSLKKSKERQFKELGENAFSDSAIAETIKQSAERQKLMELQMLNHFASIRKIGNAEQQVKFDSLFYKIWSKKKKPEEKK